MLYRRKHILTLLLAVILIVSACSGEKSVEEYVQDGRDNLEKGDLSKAIAALEEALKRDPELAEAHRLMGEALGRSERWPEAVSQYEAYQALAKDDVSAYLLLGQAYVHTGDLKKAATVFSQGAQIDPSFLADHGEEVAEASADFLQAGKEALETGDLGAATELLSIVAPLVPGQGDVYFLLGRAHLQANDILQSLTAFANGFSLNPELMAEYADDVDIVAEQGLKMGQAAMEAGDLTAAVQTIETITKLLPDEPRAHFLLGNIFNEANQFVQAIEQYNTVLNLEPESSSAHTNMGVVYYKMGDLETAIQEYDVALEIEPDDAETHYLLGAAYVQLEQLERGKAEFEAALTLDEQLAPPYIGLGNIFLLQGDFESARDVLEHAAELSPNSPEAYFALGQVYIQLGDKAEAKAALEQVLLLNPAPHWRDQAELMIESLDSE